MSESRTVFDEFFPHRVCINLDRRPERWECNESCEVTLCLSGSGLDHFGRRRKDAPPSDD